MLISGFTSQFTGMLPVARQPEVLPINVMDASFQRIDQLEISPKVNTVRFGSPVKQQQPVAVHYPPTPHWAVDIDRRTVPGLGAGYLLTHSNGRRLLVSHDMNLATAPEPPAPPPWAVGHTVLANHPTPPFEPCYRFRDAQNRSLWVPLSQNANTATLLLPTQYTLIQLPPPAPSAQSGSSHSVRPKTRRNTHGD